MSAEHFTASICARLCLRRHGEAASMDAAMDEVKSCMTSAVRAAVDVAHAAGCEVEVDGDYLIAYHSLPKEGLA